MLLRRYARWLHTGWPAGTVEKLPDVREDGTTSVPGIRVVGDLTGVPLLKFAADGGARAARAVAAELEGRRRDDDVLDLVIVGGGVSGVAAAIEARKLGLRFVLFEAAQPFFTIWNFPKGKPIYTYPTAMTPAGDLRPTATVKEALVDELEARRRAAGIEPVVARVERLERRGDLVLAHHGGEVTRARRAIVAIGRSGNFRRLNVPGEDLDKVYNRLHDPKEFGGKDVLVVGGGDSALEAAAALADAGARVTLSYRKPDFSRPKPENVEAVRRREGAGLRLALGTRVKAIAPEAVTLVHADGREETLSNDAVFPMIGREPPLDFFRRSGIRIRGEWTARTWLALAAFFGFCVFVYHWKSGGALTRAFQERGWFPFGLAEGRTAWLADPASLPGTLALSASDPGFWYSTLYCLAVVVFGFRRIRRRRTPYVRRQTYTLMAFQVVPLFLLPYLVLPWLGHNGVFDGGLGATIADNLFPADGSAHGRQYWRAFGFILAWPLFVWNFFTSEPMTWWLVIGGVQTFVLIPLLIRRWGKGAYCGWICSCGALAETLGDDHRHKMPHGPRWNRLNLLGQAILAVAVLLMLARVVSWITPGSAVGKAVGQLYANLLSGWFLSYYYVVDVWLAGIVGVGLYFWFSGRVWCRFACPLAALMHIYARFSRFRIFADKKKCISCNVCTSVCHQGIDIMNFANKGLPMEDPECVRCSACVQSCPTGVLRFGRYGADGVVIYDRLPASPVEMAEDRRAN